MFCFDSASCSERFSSAPYLMSSSGWSPQMAQSGLFSDNPSENPFAGANLAYLKYCSSDLCAPFQQSRLLRSAPQCITKAAPAAAGWATCPRRTRRTASRSADSASCPRPSRQNPRPLPSACTALRWAPPRAIPRSAADWPPAAVNPQPRATGPRPPQSLSQAQGMGSKPGGRLLFAGCSAGGTAPPHPYPWLRRLPPPLARQSSLPCPQA